MLEKLKRKMPKSIKKGIKNLFNPMKYNAEKQYVLQLERKDCLQGKIAVITGGTGSIGRAICIKLATAGAKVYVLGRSEAKANAVVNEIHQMGLEANPLLLNVLDPSEIGEKFPKTFADEGIDIFVNCAGGGSREAASDLMNQSMDVIDEVVNTNLRGAIVCTKEAVKYMGINGGKIILISSAIAFQGKKNYSEYGAAKAGIIGLMKSLAIELGTRGINVNCVSPGYIQRGEYGDREKQFLCESNCLKRVGTLEDIANAVYFFANPESDFITGQNLVVDGGRTLGLMGEK